MHLTADIATIFAPSWVRSGRTRINRGDTAKAVESTIRFDDTDARLIEGALDGDERAFRYLVERYQSQVIKTVTGMLGDSAEVHDVVQDVFIRLHGALSTYRGESTIKTFLTRIAINRSLDILRRRKRVFFVSMDSDSIETVESSAPGPEMSAIASDEQRLLRTAIDALPPKHKAVIVLRMIEGYSTSETADILGVPYGTVLSRLKRGISKLKQELGSSRGLNASNIRRSGGGR